MQQKTFRSKDMRRARRFATALIVTGLWLSGLPPTHADETCMSPYMAKITGQEDAVFRGKMLSALRQALDRDALVLPEAMRPQQVRNLLNRLGHAQKTPWNVHIRERYRHGAGVVTYLAGYLRGSPLKNARLVAWDGDRVTFTYRVSAEEHTAGATQQARMTLSSVDFLQRWLLHVPAPQTRVIRSYGLYHHTHTEALARCRAQLGQPPVGVPVTLDWQMACAQWGDLHPERCPACGQWLVCTGVIPRGSVPPPALPGVRAA